MGDLVVTEHYEVLSVASDMGKSGVLEHAIIAADNEDLSHASSTNRCVHCESAKPWTNADHLLTNGDDRADLSRQESRFDEVSDNNKADGLQKLLQFAREFEVEEALQGASHRKSHALTKGVEEEGDSTELKGLTFNVKVSPSKSRECTEVLCQGEPRSTSVALEGNVNGKAGMEVSCSEGSWSRSGGPEKEASTTCSLSDNVSDLKDKRALTRGRSQDGVSHKALGSNGTFPDKCLRTAELSKTLDSGLLMVEKALCSQCVKNIEDSFKYLSMHATPEHGDEDAMSISSIKSCSPTPKAKAGRFTSATSFKFHSDVRAEKRKKYYAKLQERLIAKEKEMKQLQAKAKKEKEEEIKLLRKSLTFKAHPVPSFYQEGPPQKPELVKTPTTRAKSPNFSRRESSFRGSTRFCNFKCEEDRRISLSPQKLGNGSNEELSNHGTCCKNSFRKQNSAKSSERNSDRNTPDTVSELLDGELYATSSESADILVRLEDPQIVSSKFMTSEEEENGDLQQMHAISNGEIEAYHNGVTLMKSNKTSVGVDSCAWRATNVLQGKLNTNAGNMSSALNKASKNAQLLASDESEDLHSKEVNVSSKKKRYKALTPYFRNRESIRDGHEAASKGRELSM